MDNQLSVYQYPTLTVLIDDSQSFLTSLAFQLNPQLACKSFHDTDAAINWLHHTHWHSTKNENEPIRVGYDKLTESFERCSASIDLDLIYRIVMNRHRFDMPAVLVIDYAMPQMNGVEFCQAVQGLPCKKILFTGQADEKIAIDAFNRKLIDRFIKKNIKVYQRNLTLHFTISLNKIFRPFFLKKIPVRMIATIPGERVQIV